MVKSHLGRGIVAGLLNFALAANIALSEEPGPQYENYTFVTWAGARETPGWHDGPGAAARFSQPVHVTVDLQGNAVVADTGNHTIRRIEPSGLASTLAGLAGRPGDEDGRGSEARFRNPGDVAVDAQGNVYVADTFNHTIRKITPDRVTTTWAGTPGQAGSADGFREAARFDTPYGLAFDPGNNLYVADALNHTIRRIDTNGQVTTITGVPGQPGNADGAHDAARFRNPSGLFIDGAGNLFVADNGNNAIRRISPEGVVSTIAGNSEIPGSNDGAGTAARFNAPFDLTGDPLGNLYVADSFNHAIRVISPEGVVTTLAGSPEMAGNANGVGNAARFNFPSGIVLNADGDLLVAENGGHVIRRVTVAGEAFAFAGAAGGPGHVDGTGNEARFNFAAGVALDGQGGLAVADLANHCVRRVSPDGEVTTVAGSIGISGANDGVGVLARFDTPTDVAVDGAGNILVADTHNHAIRRISPTGVVTTFAGAPGILGTADGAGSNARFNQPFALAFGPAGNLYVADTWNHTIRKIAPNGIVTTVAGTPGVLGKADGVRNTAQFRFPEGIAVDSSGTLFVADSANSTIRKITPNGVVTTLSGEAGTHESVDGPVESARFYFPFGIAVDAAGFLYVADNGSSTLRKISPDGFVTTLGGARGVLGSADGAGTDARFSHIEGIAVDSDGVLYIADSSNHSIRKGYPQPPGSPVIDQRFGKVGMSRGLDVSGSTFVEMNWRVVRRPAGSSAQVSSRSVRNPTITPDVADLYVLRFEGRDSQGIVALGLVELNAMEAIPSNIHVAKSVGSEVTLQASGGTPNGTFTLFASDDVSSPFAQWNEIANGRFDGQGRFFINRDSSQASRFYRIREP